VAENISQRGVLGEADRIAGLAGKIFEDAEK
jgi:hypothetical protein